MDGNERFQKTLKLRQERFLVALMASNSLAEAARTVGIGETTARRWLAQPAIREQYRSLRREAVEGAMAHIQSITSEAVATLRQLLDEEMPPAIRARAALGIIEHASKWVETTDLVERLERLEAAAAQNARTTRGGRGA